MGRPDIDDWRSVLRSKLLRDPLGPRIDVRPLAVVARVPAEGFEQEPPPCGPVIEINDSRKDAIVTGVKRVFELADLLGLLLDQSADNRVSIAERSNAEQPHGFSRQDDSVPTHKFSRFCRPRSVVHTTPEHHRIIVIKVRDLVDRANVDVAAVFANRVRNPVRLTGCPHRLRRSPRGRVFLMS